MSELHIRQTVATALSIKLCPQVIQSINLLAMNSIDLNKFVDEELLSNPLLERMDQSSASYAGNDNHNSQWSLSPYGKSYTSITENVVCDQNQSIYDHLISQLRAMNLRKSHLKAALTVVTNLDDSGYLTGSIEELAAQNEASTEQIEGAIKLVQSLEPSGIAARNLKECLKLQLIERQELDNKMLVLLDHLDELANQKYSYLMKKCQVAEDHLNDMIKIVKTLNPKPALAYKNTFVASIIPDIIITTNSLGNLEVKLNKELYEPVILSNYYKKMVVNGETDQKVNSEMTFLNSCMSRAEWLLSRLQKRAKTILKISNVIIKYQDGYLKDNSKGLNPLTLKDISNETKLHVSTVSRATRDRYIYYNGKTIELKKLLSNSVSDSNRDDLYSTDKVRTVLSNYIRQEHANSPYSDQELVDKLKGANIQISRRTVAKYRQQLSIPPANKRRTLQK